MKIYFAGSIRGGRNDQQMYFSIIEELKKYGEVLTEHIGSKIVETIEDGISDAEIYKRDMNWVKESDLIIAEVSTPSLGVGYELGQAEAMSKPVLCLYREMEGKRLSAMIVGNDYFDIRVYNNFDDIVIIFREHFSKKFS